VQTLKNARKEIKKGGGTELKKKVWGDGRRRWGELVKEVLAKEPGPKESGKGGVKKKKKGEPQKGEPPFRGTKRLVKKDKGSMLKKK